MPSRLRFVPVEVVPPGDSALDILAASMSANTWAELTTVTGQTAAISGNGNSGSAIVFCNSFPWNPIEKRIEILANDHAANPGQCKWARYLEETNEWIFTTDYGIAINPHGYDHTSCDPFTGAVYFRQYGGGVRQPNFYRRLAGETTFSLISGIGPFRNVGVAQGTCWWKGPFTAGAGHGANGAFVMYQASDNFPGNSIDFYNPLTGTWFYGKDSGVSPGSESYGGRTLYQTILEYSEIHNCIAYGGGNTDQGASNGRNIWTMNSAGVVDTILNLPASISLNSGETGTRRSVDPVTGHFILLSNAELWQLDPSVAGGTWTQRQSPPSYASGGPGNPHVGGNSRVVMVSLPEHGVIAVVTQNSTTDASGNFWLFKNA